MPQVEGIESCSDFPGFVLAFVETGKLGSWQSYGHQAETEKTDLLALTACGGPRISSSANGRRMENLQSPRSSPVFILYPSHPQQVSALLFTLYIVSQVDQESVPVARLKRREYLCPAQPVQLGSAAMDSQASTPTAAAAARVSKSAQRSAESASGSSPQRMSRKRSLSTANGDTLGSPGSDDTITHNHGRGSKGHKVSRACDHCKQRKAKCSGTIPCATCSSRGLTCLYAARYSRGRPPTPPPSRDHHPTAPVRHVSARLDHQTEPRVTVSRPENMRLSVNRLSESVPASRASPELGMAEIEGQVFDPTSGVTFLHRAWKRLAKHDGAVPVNDSHAYASVQHQPVMLAGDRPLPQTSEEDIYRLNLPGHQDLVDLLAMYFDVCIATYHIVHRPTVQSWLETIETNVQGGQVPWQGLGRARTSIVLACLAVATAHRQKSRGLASDQVDALSLSPSDHLFCVAAQLTDAETGSPRLESAQARIIQTLYLLTTSRFNRAWYTFGNGLQIISALGLHRKSARKRQLTSSPVDYIQSQFRVRTFWTAYILDKIAQIISKISREVYSIKPISEEERISAAHRLSKEVHEWKESLPPYLGSIHPSMLVPSFRRKSIVLKLGYSHAIMHANRLFLLATVYPESETQIAECLGAARSVFETVDGLAAEGPIFHAFWWTQRILPKQRPQTPPVGGMPSSWRSFVPKPWEFRQCPVATVVTWRKCSRDRRCTLKRR
ncbi:fungal specific transcription factor domain-containing protein [Verticillium dahliae VdLs.17]|uniref:Fungal specific transcription factor domain-containing protein n=1 Tax=Verticillium dahliae (strain VdLs.17 / ATCC MYA-4575 / FGSC 10137) TaxID=498257 RepID=G2WV05_VERDV|nr:fungal specific transcription factor domain-containing protein [Verticillium dahliae VdLs.17]EGY20130.1 fungal specific transcription factor domain-containing protein [Verticillium dahliae VdLs.17]